MTYWLKLRLKFGYDIAAQCDAAADPDAAVDLDRMSSCKTISTGKRLRAGKEIPDAFVTTHGCAPMRKL